jgi:hypothetical protein
MSNRYWFYADRGQQQGPFPEAQFRDFIARGMVRADTLVWTEGMAGWQSAGEIPGFFSPAARSPSTPGRMPAMANGDGGALSIDFEILEFVGRFLLFIFGVIFVLPLPWILVSNLKWLTSRTRVPGRPDLGFTGEPMGILLYYLGGVVAIIVLHIIGGRSTNFLSFLIEIALGWAALRWFFANLSSGGQPLGLSFSGSYWMYLGWNLLGALATLTIIGWAWVYTAQTRWVYRNVDGTHREIVFKASGLEYLWRAIVCVIASAFIIPIPWVARWMMGWLASQTVLVERGAYAEA